MKKIQEYKKDLKDCNENIMVLKDNILTIKLMVENFESDELYKSSMLQLGQLVFIKSWLENKLK